MFGGENDDNYECRRNNLLHRAILLYMGQVRAHCSCSLFFVFDLLFSCSCALLFFVRSFISGAKALSRVTGGLGPQETEQQYVTAEDADDVKQLADGCCELHAQLDSLAYHAENASRPLRVLLLELRVVSELTETQLTAVELAVSELAVSERTVSEWTVSGLTALSGGFRNIIYSVAQYCIRLREDARDGGEGYRPHPAIVEGVPIKCDTKNRYPTTVVGGHISKKGILCY